jgi:hypothetical protein
MSDDNVIPVAFNTRYGELDALLVELKDAIYRYADRVPVASTT